MLEKDARQPSATQDTKLLPYRLLCSKLVNSSGRTQCGSSVDTAKGNRAKSPEWGWGVGVSSHLKQLTKAL